MEIYDISNYNSISAFLIGFVPSNMEESMLHATLKLVTYKMYYIAESYESLASLLLV